jgi:hypothetical protein
VFACIYSKDLNQFPPDMKETNSLIVGSPCIRNVGLYDPSRGSSCLGNVGSSNFRTFRISRDLSFSMAFHKLLLSSQDMLVPSLGCLISISWDRTIPGVLLSILLGPVLTRMPMVLRMGRPEWDYSQQC